MDFPEVKLLEMPLKLDEVDKGEARIEPSRLKETELRKVVRGIWDGADIDSFRVFHYPVYKVEKMLRQKKRFALIGGRLSKELSF